jgi:hypothetical protein
MARYVRPGASRTAAGRWGAGTRYWITSSARTKTLEGTSKPSALAVLRLRTTTVVNENLCTCLGERERGSTAHASRGASDESGLA